MGLVEPAPNYQQTSFLVQTPHHCMVENKNLVYDSEDYIPLIQLLDESSRQREQRSIQTLPFWLRHAVEQEEGRDYAYYSALSEEEWLREFRPLLYTETKPTPGGVWQIVESDQAEQFPLRYENYYGLFVPRTAQIASDQTILIADLVYPYPNFNPDKHYQLALAVSRGGIIDSDYGCHLWSKLFPPEMRGQFLVQKEQDDNLYLVSGVSMLDGSVNNHAVAVDIGPKTKESFGYPTRNLGDLLRFTN